MHQHPRTLSYPSPFGRPLVLLLAALALAVFLALLAQAAAPSAQAATKDGSVVWTSDHWSNGKSRTMSAGKRDTHDPTGWSEAVGPSGIKVQIDGKGVMTLSGGQPRFYIQSEKYSGKKFTNVEVTVYYRRVKDDNTPWGGLTIGVRSGTNAHGNPNGDECNAHTYYMRFMNSGAVDFDKELAHPEHGSRARKEKVFGSKFPYDKWIGGRFRVYNLPNGHVKLEAYADFGDGKWKLVNETVDDGSWASKGSSSCKQWRTDRDIYTGGGVVFIRNTDVDKAQYKDLTVRNLDAGPVSTASATTTTSTTAAAKVPLRVNVGGGKITDSQGNVWIADQSYGSGKAYGYVNGDSKNGSSNHKVTITGSKDTALYTTERYGMSAYRVNLPNGNYDVRLLFAETYSGITGKGQRVFDVAVEGKTIASKLDVYAEAGFAKPLIKEVPNVKVSDGRLDITFTQRSKERTPILKGIEVLPAGTLGKSTATSTSTKIVGIPFRVNVGGSKVTTSDGKVWVADQAYSSSNGYGYVDGNDRYGTSVHNTTVKGTKDTVLYTSERWGLAAYRVNVPNGNYDVRLLFAETYSGITGKGQRVFDVAVEGSTVASKLDLYAVAGFAKPLIKEVTNVKVTDGRLDVTFTQRTPQRTPILKAVEVLPAGTIKASKS